MAKRNCQLLQQYSQYPKGQMEYGSIQGQEGKSKAIIRIMKTGKSYEIVVKKKTF